MTAATPNHPVVLWAQRKDRVFASVQLDDIQKEEISIDSEKLTFSCHCAKDNKSYKVELVFFDDIVPEESKQRKGGREFFFDLKKKNTSDGWWSRLLKAKTKNQFIKVDFHRWVDEDELEDEKGDAGMYDNSNLEDMMAKMGGAGGAEGFDPGEMPESDDSDDDEIPDLVEEEKK